jgi:GDP-L-fucose synthase
MDRQKRIYIAGHRGLVGSAIVRRLQADDYENLITRTHQALDLTQQSAVQTFFQTEKPDYVILAAAKVGGILANNSYPADFIYQNLMIEANIIHAAFQNNIKNLLFLGSSCIYPKFAEQPMKEESLLTGILESTNEPYAIAKIAGIKLCESYNRQFGTNYRSVMPTNLYGIGDNFDLNNSHVLPALLRKCHEAKYQKKNTLEVWGTGTPRREFLNVDDLADACLFVMNLSNEIYQTQTQPMLSHLNIGVGEDVSIRKLAELIARVVGFEGELVFDISKPDGTPRKLLDVSRLKNLGWQAKISLEEGIRKTYQWYVQQPFSTPPQMN